MSASFLNAVDSLRGFMQSSLETFNNRLHAPNTVTGRDVNYKGATKAATFSQDYIKTSLEGREPNHGLSSAGKAFGFAYMDLKARSLGRSVVWTHRLACLVFDVFKAKPKTIQTEAGALDVSKEDILKADAKLFLLTSLRCILSPFQKVAAFALACGVIPKQTSDYALQGLKKVHDLDDWFDGVESSINKQH